MTAAGMLMLALRYPDDVAQWLQGKALKAYTSHAITSKDRLLVEFARIRANGWAMSEQQMELTYRGIAVPLLDRHGDLVGGLNVSMPMGAVSRADARPPPRGSRRPYLCR